MSDWQQVEHTATGENGEKYALINGEWITVTHTATGAKGEKYALGDTGGIPGGVIPQEKLRAEYEKKRNTEIKRAGGELNYGLSGVGEAGLNLLSQIPAQAVGAAAVGVHGLGKLLGVYPKSEDTSQAASNVMEKLIYQPRTEIGQEYTNRVGEVVNRYLMPLGPGMHISPYTKLQRQVMSAERLQPTKSGLGFEQTPIAKAGKVVDSEVSAQVAAAKNRAVNDAINAAKLRQEGKAPAEVATPWEKTVKDLGGEIPPKETPFSSMVDSLTGNPRVLDPEFKMAPEAAPYVKGAGEAARDDATAARLQAAVDRQNPRQSTIAIGKEGDAFSASAENFAARDRAEQTQLSALDQHVQDPFTKIVEQLTPKEAPKAEVTPVDPFEQIKQQALEQGNQQRYAQAQAAIDARQKQLEFETARKALLDKNAAEAQRQQQAPSGYENWVAQQRQAAEQRLPGNNDPLNFNKESAPYSLGDAPYQYKGGLDFTQYSAGDMQAPVIRSMQEKAAWEQRSKEQLAESARANTQEAKQQAQEGALQPLEEQLRREAYQPPTQEDLRAGHLAGRDPRINKFRQGGAIDPKIIEDLKGLIDTLRGKQKALQESGMYKNLGFVQQMDMLLPLIRQENELTTKLNDFYQKDRAERHNQEITDLRKTLSDTTSGLRRSSFTSIEGSPIRKLGSSGEGGAVDPAFLKDVADGIVRTARGAYKLVKPERPVDSITTPTSPENIAKKQEMSNKAKAIGLKDTVWDTPTTVEEAIATTHKDLGPLTQRFGAGAAGTAHRNPKNGVVKFINDIRQKSQQAHERSVTQFLNGKDGAAKALRDVPHNEYPAIMDLKNKLAEAQVDYTREIGEAAGLSEKANAYMEAAQRASNAAADALDAASKRAGLEPLNRRRGHFSSNWDRGYPARVGYWKERTVNGKKERYFETKAFVSEETALGRHNAKKWYEQKYPGISVEYLGRQGLNTASSPIRGFDALGTVMAEIAKHDPEFAKWKEIADGRIAENTSKLYGVDKHFLSKKGVEGYRGNKPWKDAMANAKDGLLAEIEHLNQVFKYASQQDFVNTAKQIVSDPKMQDKPNTTKWVDLYTKHVTGESLNWTGTTMNGIVDGVFMGMGLGGNIPHKVSQAIRTVGQSMLLNISNARYAVVNTMQILNAIPEMAKVVADAGLNPLDIPTSMAAGSNARFFLGVATMMGKDLDGAPIAPHLIEAYKWGQEHGIHHYTETVNSREILDSKAMHYGKKAISWPSTVPEWMTRPTAFLWFVDLFHKSGLRGEELYTKARGATDYALANAVREEKPQIYTSLGIMGNHIGELRNYQHNMADQYMTRVLEGKTHKLALGSALGIGLLTQGVSGAMMYQEADLLSQWLTGKTLREHAGWIGKNHKIYDGVISGISGSDWQSSFSMADGLPDPSKPWETVAGASVMKMIKIGMAGYQYADMPSHASFADLAKNTVGGLGGLVEDQMLTSPEGYVLDKKGQHKYESPRSPEERKKRAILGVRPLRERIEDESLYARDKKMKQINEKDKKYLDALVAAQNFKDPKAYQQALNGFLDNGGDPDKLSNVIDKNELEAYISARQRHGGIDPGDSITTIRRWMNYQE